MNYLAAAASIPAQTHRAELLDLTQPATSFHPADIRRAIAQWVGQDRMDMAEALVAAGLAMHPDSEDILAIAALVAEMNQDWAQAQDCLEHLMGLQGDAVSAEISYHLVRVMRCRAAFHLALGQARRGLARHPGHAGLSQEHDELCALLESVPVTVAPVLQTS